MAHDHLLQVADGDGVSALVRVLTASPPSTTLPTAAALAALASNSPQNRQRMVAAGAVPLLVRALQGVVQGGDGGHPGLCWAPAAALAYAALEPAQKRVVAGAGVVPLLARGLRQPVDAATPAMCAAAAWFLALHDDFNAQVRMCLLVVTDVLLVLLLVCIENTDLFCWFRHHDYQGSITLPQAMRRAGMVRTLRSLLADGGPRGRMYAAGALTVLAGDDEALLTAIRNTGSVLMLTKHYHGLTEFDFLAKDAIAVVRCINANTRSLVCSC